MVDLQAPSKIITPCLLWVAFLLIVSRSATASTSNYRLPRDVAPEHYKIDITANLEEDDFSFHGKATIQLKCLKNTNKIVLHAYTLTVNTDALKLNEVTDSEGASEPQKILSALKIVKSSYDSVNEFFIVETEHTLKANHTYSYEVPYKGVLNTTLFGFYRSSYFDQAANKTRWLAVTQFSPIHARKAFPCFDEPGMKATFTISLSHKDSLTALGNMPVKNMTPLEGKSGWTKTQFEKTVRMSTYLVGFMISDFKHLPPTKTDHTGIPFRVWVREEALEQTKFSGDIGPKLLSFLEQYFGIDFPLPKQDMAAIPDFNFNAMENWGLITFREKALLFDPNSTSVGLQQSGAFTMAHEIAHQWFGNLVTMQWWTDLWLKEGFASYLGAIAMDNVISEWNTMNYQMALNLFYTFSLDCLNSSHPVSVPIGNPNEVAQLFDKIPYAKGPLIIRMMNHFLGDDAFRAGLESYLHRFAYGNAEKDDLWEELTTVAHKRGVLPTDTTVKAIMDTWTVQTGYPLIHVERNYNKGTAKVSQSRYLLQNASLRSELGAKQWWWVPLSYTSQENPDFNTTKPKAWLSSSGPVTVADLPDENNWVLFNIKATGSFRVNYDLANWKLLTKTLMNETDFMRIDLLNRMLLVADSLSLAWTADLPYELVFKLATYLKHEPEFIVWDTADSYFLSISSLLRDTSDDKKFKAYLQRIVRPVYQKMGPLTTEPKGSEASRMKALITGLARRCNLDLYEEEAAALFGQMISSGQDSFIPKDVRASVYLTGIALNGEREWQILWNRYVASNIPAEKDNILLALGNSKDEARLRQYLDWSIDENSKIRRQDTPAVFNTVAANQIGYPLAKSFFVRRCRDIYNFFGAKTAKMGGYLTELAKYIHTEEELNEINDVIAKNADIFEYSKLAKNQFHETVDNNIVWFKTNQNSIGAALGAAAQ